MNVLRLIPTPARVRHIGDASRVPPDALAWCEDAIAASPAPTWLHEQVQGGWCGADLRDAQSYRLMTRPDPSGELLAEITAPTPVGVRHARATLVQLLRQSPTHVPSVEIEDRPAIDRRGVMLDVSRCRIPTMDEFPRILDALARLKCNHLQLYTEHTFAYPWAQSVWEGWSPLTPDEIRTLDLACAARGIELVANQNCFGHLREWLEKPGFAHLAETHGDWMFDVWPRSGPFSLCPTDPASLRFVERLLGDLLPNFSHPFVNIGCDETYDIAYGRSAQTVRRRGRGAVYAEFVAKIAEIARAHGKASMFWGDIALSHPDCLTLLEPDMIPLAWGYEPDAPWDDWCRALARHEPRWTHGFWLCPGTSSWRSLTGRTNERTANLESAARACVAHHAAGMLICDWGDSGHWQTWPIALHALAHGLHAAWTGGKAFDPAAAGLHCFGTPNLGPWLELLGDVDLPLREVAMPLSRPGVAGRIRNQTAIFADLFQPWAQATDVGTPELWRTCRERLEALGPPPVAAETLVIQELVHTLDLTRQALDRFGARRGWGDPTPPERWADAQARHRVLWLERSRPGGLEPSAAFFRKVVFDLTPG